MGKTNSLGIVVNDDATVEGVKDFGKSFGDKVEVKEVKTSKKTNSGDTKDTTVVERTVKPKKPRMHKVCVATIVFCIFTIIWLAFGSFYTFIGSDPSQTGSNPSALDMGGIFALAGACFAFVPFALFIPQTVSGFRRMKKNNAVKSDIWLNIINIVMCVLLFAFIIAVMTTSIMLWGGHPAYSIVINAAACQGVFWGIILYVMAHSFMNKNFPQADGIARTKRAMYMTIGTASIFAFVWFMIWFIFRIASGAYENNSYPVATISHLVTAIFGFIIVFFAIAFGYYLYENLAIKKHENFVKVAIVHGIIAGILLILLIILGSEISIKYDVYHMASAGNLVLGSLVGFPIMFVGIMSLIQAKKILPKVKKAKKSQVEKTA